MSTNLNKHCSVGFRAGFKNKSRKRIILECLKSFPYIWVSLDRVLIVSIYLKTLGVTQLVVGKCQLLIMLCRLTDLTILVLSFQFVSTCSPLLCFKLADDDSSRLSRMSVPVVSHCISSLLMMPFLGYPGSEWQPYICLPNLLTMLLLGSSSWCVATVSHFMMLTTLVLNSPACEWLTYLAVL